VLYLPSEEPFLLPVLFKIPRNLPAMLEKFDHCSQSMSCSLNPSRIVGKAMLHQNRELKAGALLRDAEAIASGLDLLRTIVNKGKVQASFKS
jgi:hypothetical protein